MKVGDLVFLNWGSVPELEHVKPSEWFAQSVARASPLIFLGWTGNNSLEEGWADLLHHDGSKKTVHCDYFTRLTK